MKHLYDRWIDFTYDYPTLYTFIIGSLAYIAMIIGVFSYVMWIK